MNEFLRTMVGVVVRVVMVLAGLIFLASVLAINIKRFIQIMHSFRRLDAE